MHERRRDLDDFREADPRFVCPGVQLRKPTASDSDTRLTSGKVIIDNNPVHIKSPSTKAAVRLATDLCVNEDAALVLIDINPDGTNTVTPEVWDA